MLVVVGKAGSNSAEICKRFTEEEKLDPSSG